MHYREILLVGALTVLAGSTVSGVANARGISGYGAFRPWPHAGAQDCVVENWSAALSKCGSLQSMWFNAPVEVGNAWHDIWAWSYGGGWGYFTCQAVSFGGSGGSYWINWGAQDTFNPSGQESRKFSVYVPGGWTLILNCWNVPYDRGIASLVYND